MTSFAFIAAVLLLLALYLVIRPLIKSSTTEQVDRGQINLDIYQQRLNELEKDLNEGHIAREDYTAAQQDLERQAIADIPPDKQTQYRDTPASKLGVIAILILIPALSIGLYMELGQPEAITNELAQPQPARTADNTQNDQPAPSVEEMIVRIEQRLAEQPDDARGWGLLSRAYMHTQQFEKAEAALDKLTTLVPDDPNNWANYADIAAVNQQGNLSGKPYEYIKRALALQPKHPKALWLAGTYHYQQENYKTALRFWNILKQQLPPESKDNEIINASIAEAKSRLDPDAIPQETETSSTETSDPVKVVGSVSLADTLIKDVSAGDTVFVFARAAAGPRMPLAVVKKQVKDLPFEFQLDDSMAMMPQLTLSSFDKVVISARISRTGDAMPQSGDLVSNEVSIDPKEKRTIELTIQNVNP